MADETVKDRLIKAFEELRYSKKTSSQTDFGAQLDYNKSYISEIFNGKKPISTSLADAIQTKFGINAIWLLTGIGEMHGISRQKPIKTEAFGLGAIDDDQWEKGTNNKEFLDLGAGNLLMRVPLIQNHAAYCGYLKGHADPEWIEEQPKHDIPVNQRHKGQYLAFIAKGDSMNDGTEDSISDGDIVTGRVIAQTHWSSKLHLKSFSKYVIVHKDGILVKEIVNHDVANGLLTLHSTNPDKVEYPDMVVSLEDVNQILNITHVTKKTNNPRQSKAEPEDDFNRKLAFQTIDLTPRKKEKLQLYTNGHVNRPLFEAIMPDDNTTHNYVPYYRSAHDIISSYADLITLKDEAMRGKWLQTPYIDDVFRVEYESSFCTTYMHDNMAPDVPLGSKITAIFKPFNKWKPGALYCVFFSEGEIYIYSLAEGKSDRHIKIIDGKNDFKQQLIEDILCIALVQDITRPK